MTPHALIVSGDLDSGMSPLTKAGSACDFFLSWESGMEKPGDGGRVDFAPAPPL